MPVFADFAMDIHTYLNIQQSQQVTSFILSPTGARARANLFRSVVLLNPYWSHHWSHYCLPLLISLLADTTGPSTVCHYCSLLVTLLRTIAVYLFTTLVKLLFTITELTIGRHYWAHYCSPLLLTTVGHTTVHFWSHYRAPLLLDCSRLLLTLLFTTTAFTTGDTTAHHCCLPVRHTGQTTVHHY